MSIEYKNKEWLKNKYSKEKLSTIKIAKICNVHSITICRWLNRFDIPIRSRGEATHLASGNHCNLSEKAIEWINGELLGDGYMQSYSSKSARIGYSSKYLEYCKYVSNTLKLFGIEQIGNINECYHKKMNCYTYRYTSRSYAELLPVFKQWYPKGKKIVPKDIKLTPLTIRQWYIGDGFLKNRMRKHGRPHIVLYTDGFLISDVKWLVGRLIKLKFKATRWLSRNVICLSVNSTKDFFDYIGNCPISCYQYKFNYKTI